MLYHRNSYKNIWNFFSETLSQAILKLSPNYFEIITFIYTRYVFQLWRTVIKKPNNSNLGTCWITLKMKKANVTYGLSRLCQTAEIRFWPMRFLISGKDRDPSFSCFHLPCSWWVCITPTSHQAQKTCINSPLCTEKFICTKSTDTLQVSVEYHQHSCKVKHTLSVASFSQWFRSQLKQCLKSCFLFSLEWVPIFIHLQAQV